jgi:MerR family transcriptional regulator, light-induced transcriptional regulator
MSGRLVGDSLKIPKVSAASAAHYEQNLAGMLDKVNARMGANPAVMALIGNNPLQVMYDNHRHHAMLLSNLMRLNHYEVLAVILPWVYRTYRSHGFSQDYFPAMLNAWMAVIKETLPESSAAEVTGVYRWILGRHETNLQEADQLNDQLSSKGASPDSVVSGFVGHLLGSDYKAARRFCEDWLEKSGHISDLYLRIFQPALYRIGWLWEHSEISVVQEHLATAVIGRLMSDLYSRLPVAQKRMGRAVITSGFNEYHETGARMVSDLLEMDGWEIFYLGANVPASELLGFLKDKRPFLLAVSLTMPFNLAPLQQFIAQARKDPDISGVKIMVGGLAFMYSGGLWKEIGADGYAEDAQSAGALAREWWVTKV